MEEKPEIPIHPEIDDILTDVLYAARACASAFKNKGEGSFAPRLARTHIFQSHFTKDGPSFPLVRFCDRTGSPVHSPDRAWWWTVMTSSLPGTFWMRYRRKSRTLQ